MSSLIDMEICDDRIDENEEVEDGELIDDEVNDDDNNIPDLEGDRLILRAKRFGLTEINSKQTTINPKLKKLHNSMGDETETRKEALHLYGTDSMKTHDIFAYFSGYSPASIEWLSDKSCNVVWLDEESCAKALKNLSFKIKGQATLESDNSDDNEESVNVEDIRCALPPGIWRKGQSHTLAPSLFMRFATCYDKKVTKPQTTSLPGNGVYNRNLFLDEGDEVAKKSRHDTGNPWSDIAREWRNFENRSSALPVKDAREVLRHKDVKRQKTLTERLLLRSEGNCESKNHLPTIRKMQADIEEKKILERNKLRTNMWKDKPESDLRDRLGRKRKRNDIEYEEVNNKWKDDGREDVSLRIEIDNSGDYTDEEWEDYKSDKSSDSDEVATRPNTGDLRSKLEKKKSHQRQDISDKSVLRTRYMKYSKKGSSFSPLRIEIDNDVYNRSDDD